MALGLEENGHVVFVCMGNIHRSPLAAAMFKIKMEGRGRQCVVESAGLIDVGCHLAANEWATHKFASHFDLSTHRSRHISAIRHTKETFFVCAEESMIRDVRSLAGVSPERVLLLHPSGVGDPRLIGYDACFTLIHTGLAMLERKLGID